MHAPRAGGIKTSAVTKHREVAMEIDYLFFVTQRERNAAWNLLCANHAPN